MAYLRKLESGRWQAAIRKRGHPSTSKTFRTKAAAETWARGRENEIERGEALETVPANQWTIKMLLDWYGDISEHKKGWKKERSRYRILKHWLGKRTLATLSVDDLRRYAKDRGVKSDTIRRDLSVLSAAIEAARTLKNVALRENVS
ncbi:MAG: hypothetical protein GY943_28010, partial [Chloroflexi bacterium]|nr:hypothetical protein [Chloroflexota bacterium]